MGRKKPTSQPYAFSIPYKGNAEALIREPVLDTQVRFDDNTIIWGDDDALPLRILHAVNSSPSATSCLGKVSDYIQGSGFTDPGIASHVIDEDGTTLGQLHNILSDYISKLEGFSCRFTYNIEGRITNCYVIPMESCRFVRPPAEQSRAIKQIKYNPYWGVSNNLFKQALTESYPVWNRDQKSRYQEIKNWDDEKNGTYRGQIYFEGTPRAPYKFYPVPKFWSGSNWIYVDATSQSFVKELLDNGFFQSVIINMIGDPTQPSKNPKYQIKKVGDDGVTRTEWDGKTTVGLEFQEMMSKSFSGYDKAGKAMVWWAKTINEILNVQAFPVNANFENISGTLTNAIRGITIATEVPAILANLPQQVSSLGSDGDSMRVAVELMQARVKEPQQILENFYNKILLPNQLNTTSIQAKIKNHTPLSNQVQVPDKVWEWMNDEEKAEFVRNNVPSVTVKREAAIVAPVPGVEGEPPAQGQVNDALKALKKSEINRIKSISNDVEKGKLTYDQAKQILLGYGLDDEQIKAWLTEPEEAVLV